MTRVCACSGKNNCEAKTNQHLFWFGQKKMKKCSSKLTLGKKTKQILANFPSKLSLFKRKKETEMKKYTANVSKVGKGVNKYRVSLMVEQNPWLAKGFLLKPTKPFLGSMACPCLPDKNIQVSRITIFVCHAFPTMLSWKCNYNRVCRSSQSMVITTSIERNMSNRPPRFFSNNKFTGQKAEPIRSCRLEEQ